MAQHEAQRILTGSAERHPDADFVRALPGGVCRYYVDSHGRQHKSQESEYDNKRPGDPLADVPNLLSEFQGGHVGNIEVAVQPMNLLLDGLAICERISRSPHRDG